MPSPPAKPVAVTMFAGQARCCPLSLVERGMTSLLKVPNGDFRDWVTIAVWARGLPEKDGDLAPGSRRLNQCPQEEEYP